MALLAGILAALLACSIQASPAYGLSASACYDICFMEGRRLGQDDIITMTQCLDECGTDQREEEEGRLVRLRRDGEQDVDSFTDTQGGSLYRRPHYLRIGRGRADWGSNLVKRAPAARYVRIGRSDLRAEQEEGQDDKRSKPQQYVRIGKKSSPSASSEDGLPVEGSRKESL